MGNQSKMPTKENQEGRGEKREGKREGARECTLIEEKDGGGAAVSADPGRSARLGGDPEVPDSRQGCGPSTLSPAAVHTC